MMLKKILFTAAILTAITNVHAAGSAPFGVTGTITPAACNVTLTNGVANMSSTSAVIKAYSTVGGAYILPELAIPIGVICTAATKVAVSFVDNLSGKRITVDSNDGVRYGMVDGAGTTAIGSYQMRLYGVTMDGVAAGQFMTAVTGATTWATTGVTGLNAGYGAPGYSVAFSKTAGAVIPDSFTTFAGTFGLDPFISAAYVNAATSAITPTGSGTLALVYL